MGAQRRNQRQTDRGPEFGVGERRSSSEDLSLRQVPERGRWLPRSFGCDGGGSGSRSGRSGDVLRTLYAGLAPVYAQLVPFVSSAARSRAVSWVNAAPGDRVLDVGCGTGRALRQLAASSPEGWTDGLDVTPAMLARARARLASLPHYRYRVQEGRAEALPYSDDTFDAVLSSYVLDVLPRPAANTALCEMHRVLRPEGRLVIVVLTPPARPLEFLWATLARCAPLLLGGARPIRPGPLLRRTGFAVERRRTHTQLGLRSGLLEASPR